MGFVNVATSFLSSPPSPSRLHPNRARALLSSEMGFVNFVTFSLPLGEVIASLSFPLGYESATSLGLFDLGRCMHT